MTGTRRISRALAALLFAAPIILIAWPAWATPSNTRVSRVHELPCDGPVCQSGEDPTASEGAVVDGTIQIHVGASSSLGLSYVELQARQVLNGDAGSWICMRRWSGPGSSFSDYFNWSTARWPGESGTPPSGCSASSLHGDRTRNAVYDFRVQAADATGTATSSLYSVKLSNAATTPTWEDDPAASGADEGAPVVELRWRANSEPDIVEYHFIRSNPNGEETEYAVSATKPGGQGCEKDGDIYLCTDDDFPSNFAGTYEYSLVALRTSPSAPDSCSLPPYGDCVVSESAGGGSVNLEEPPTPGPDVTDTPATGGGGNGGGGSSGGSGSSRTPAPVGGRGGGGGAGEAGCFYCGKFDNTLPFENGGLSLPGGEGTTPVAIGPDGEPIFETDTSGRARAMRVLAGGLIMLLVAAHLARVLRDTTPID